MKIAVTHKDGQIFQHFGQTTEFKVYDVEDGKVASSLVVSTDGASCGALAGFLTTNEVNAVICGGIGEGAQNALERAEIKLYAGVKGDADAAVEALLSDTLEYETGANCSHEEEGHECAEHGLGQGCGVHRHGHGHGPGQGLGQGLGLGPDCTRKGFGPGGRHHD